MRVVVIGATGRTGQQVTEQALQRGHQVTAVVRSLSVPEKQDLRVVVADPCDAKQLIPALEKQDAMISCLGQRAGGNPWLVRDATTATLEAMSVTGVRRLVLVSGALLYASRNLIVLLLKRVMAGKLTDGRAAEALITASAVDWTIVRPPRLLEGSQGKGYRVETGDHPKLTRNLLFRDLAACLLDLAEDGAYRNQVVGVASR